MSAHKEMAVARATLPIKNLNIRIDSNGKDQPCKAVAPAFGRLDALAGAQSYIRAEAAFGPDERLPLVPALRAVDMMPLESELAVVP